MQQFDVNFMNFGHWKEGIKSNNLPTLGKLFDRLVEQLPDVVVFCVIDGISIFEVEPWASELLLILETLLGVVTNDEVSARVKLLFACASRSRYLSGRLAEQNVISVPGNAGNPRLLTSRTTQHELSGDKRLIWEEETGGRNAPQYHPSYADVYEQGYD